MATSEAPPGFPHDAAFIVGTINSGVLSYIVECQDARPPAIFPFPIVEEKSLPRMPYSPNSTVARDDIFEGWLALNCHDMRLDRVRKFAAQSKRSR